MYNLGTSLLHNGNPVEAFDTFLKTVPVFQTNPHLWLRLAECCIAINCDKGYLFGEMLSVPAANSASNQKDQQKPPLRDSKRERVFDLVGNSSRQKIVLRNEGDEIRKDSHRSTAGPALTLAFASSCLTNAFAIVTSMEQNPNRPSSVPVTTKSKLFKANVLLKHSYVDLCLENHLMAFNRAQLVVKMEGIPAGYQVLARLYCGEALVYLDRISEAIAHLDPRNVQDVVIKEDEISSASELIAGRALFSYNLAVAYCLRGELDKASDLIDSLWSGKNTHKISDRVLMLKIYLLIKKGGAHDLKACRDLIRKNASLRSV